MNEEMTNNDETLETLKQIQLDIGDASRNIHRLGSEYNHSKKLDPAKIRAVTISLNRASYLLREKITSMLSEEERDW